MPRILFSGLSVFIALRLHHRKNKELFILDLCLWVVFFFVNRDGLGRGVGDENSILLGFLYQNCYYNVYYFSKYCYNLHNLQGFGCNLCLFGKNLSLAVKILILLVFLLKNQVYDHKITQKSKCKEL